MSAAAAAFVILGLWLCWYIWVREPSTEEQREQLLATNAELLREDFGPGDTPDSKGVQGDIVWSNNLQRGFVRLYRLPVNDPSQQRYQIWIKDGKRGGLPVDGGLFDVPRRRQAGAVIVPVRPKLPIRQARAFLITLEQADGVVVSKRERVMARTHPE